MVRNGFNSFPSDFGPYQDKMIVSGPVYPPIDRGVITIGRTKVFGKYESTASVQRH